MTKKSFLKTLFFIQLSFNVFSQNTYNVDVFFAQTHVQRPTDTLFKLISDRNVLIKVNISSVTDTLAPPINIVLKLHQDSISVPLTGPAILPPPLNFNLGEVNHQFSDSYVATIPSEWVKPGLKLTLNVGNQTSKFDSLKIGAPNKLNMNMFDIHFFQQTNGNYPTGWKEELEEKIPVSRIDLTRVPNIIFNEITVQPQSGKPAVKVFSIANYHSLTGIPFEGEQQLAGYWINALKRAAGQNNQWVSLFYLNIYGVFTGGQGSLSNFSGVGNGSNPNILNHELGHIFSLPHWGNVPSYPYKGDMYGIQAPPIFMGTHAGPVWAYDAKKNLFIPPTVQTNSVGGNVGNFKKDPMQGQGGDQEIGFIYRHFSDYSVHKMKNYMENKLVIWNDSIGNYASWNTTTKSYSLIKPNNGVQYPLVRDAQVYSILASVCSTAPDANIVYPPIGPYKSGLIRLFDPTIEAERQSAVALNYCPAGGCDLTAKVTQNGVEKFYLMPQSVDMSKLPTDIASFTTSAINLDANDGIITKVELLYTPNAQTLGLAEDTIVLYTYEINPTANNKLIEDKPLIKDDNLFEHISIFPNPSTNEIKIDLTHVPEENVLIEILDFTGKVIAAEQTVSGKMIEISLANHAAGQYKVRISNNKGSRIQEVLKN